MERRTKETELFEPFWMPFECEASFIYFCIFWKNCDQTEAVQQMAFSWTFWTSSFAFCTSSFASFTSSFAFSTFSSAFCTFSSASLIFRLSRRTDSANENEKTGLFWGTKCSSPLQSEPGRQKRLTSDESCLSESQLFRLSFQVLSFQFLSVSFTFCLKKQNCWTLDDLSRANMSHATWHVDLQHAGAFKSKRSKIEATNKRKVAVEKREFNGW